MPRYLHRFLSRMVTATSGARVVSHDDGPPQFPDQAIYYANHSSHLDFVTLWAIMPAHLQPRVRPIAARDYWGTGVRKKVAEGLFNAYLVDRHGSGSSQRQATSGVSPRGQLHGMTQILDDGDSLIIFPEGTRGAADSVARFHSGLYRLASHAPHLPVVPVTLKDLGRILPKGEFLPVPHLSTVIVHEPLHVDEAETRQEFLHRARHVLVQSLTPPEENL